MCSPGLNAAAMQIICPSKVALGGSRGPAGKAVSDIAGVAARATAILKIVAGRNGAAVVVLGCSVEGAGITGGEGLLGLCTLCQRCVSSRVEMLRGVLTVDNLRKTIAFRSAGRTLTYH